VRQRIGTDLQHRAKNFSPLSGLLLAVASSTPPERKAGFLVVCEEYRVEMMGLLDGELLPARRNEIMAHLDHCCGCRGEFEHYTRLASLTRQLHFRALPKCECEYYWASVCEKLQTRYGWRMWFAGSGALMGAGALMIFGVPGALSLALGFVSVTAGICVLGLSYFCKLKH
jgi:predicted anti-sigma-YlaC factor YlaD